jgi:orotate phosphoribosyltransferase
MPTDQDLERAKLKALLSENSVRTGHFKLASGAESDVYVDGKLTTCLPEAMPLIGRAFLCKIRERGWVPDAIGGLTVGADPIAFATARESLETGRSIRAFIVRKEPKKHGMGRFIEGLEDCRGLQVVIIDDVCTKGGSTAQAIQNARDAGMKVLGAVCLVDREMGAKRLLEGEYQCPFDSIFTLAELLAYKHEPHIVSDPVCANM